MVKEGATSQETQVPLEAGKGREQSLPKSLQKEHSPSEADFPLGFGYPEL